MSAVKRERLCPRCESPELLPRVTPVAAAAGGVLSRPMALQNRVTPFGDLVADPARGLVYGNRGCLHDEHGTIRRRYNGKGWIACRLEFRGWKRERLLQAGRFTELFFLDEATAFAAGHRPCALCRHEDYRKFVTLWHKLHPDDDVGADAIDALLHAERVDPGSPGGQGQRRSRAAFETLPDGTFVLHDAAPFLVLDDRLLRWAPAGYKTVLARPRGPATVLTPPSLVDVLREGWEGVVPLLHPSADIRATG